MMKSSYGLVRDWVIKKMNLDEQIFKSVDKQMLNELVNENVTIHKKPYFNLSFLK